VRFAAHELFGEGGHAVVVELWEDYLEPVGDRRPP
jgi:nitrile hydratase